MDVIRLAQQLRAFVDALMRTPYVRALELQADQLRVDCAARLREKDAVIADLRVRLAVAEIDALRVKAAVVAPIPVRPVPEFDGPLSFQDELAAMRDELEMDAVTAKKEAD